MDKASIRIICCVVMIICITLPFLMYNVPNTIAETFVSFLLNKPQQQQQQEPLINVDLNSTESHYGKNKIQNFEQDLNQKYPFSHMWLFDAYKKNINESRYTKFEEEFSSLIKLNGSYLIFDKFIYRNCSYPFFNPAIIRLDNIPNNYYDFVSKNIKSVDNINIIRQTRYLLLGRHGNSMCKNKYNNNDFDDMKMPMSGVLLFDEYWNVLKTIPVIFKYDYDIKHTQKEFIIKYLTDCRLFVYLSMIYADCIGYKHWTSFNFIGPLLWYESNENKELIIVLNAKQSHFPSILRTRNLRFDENTNDSYVLYSDARNFIPLIYNNELYFQVNIQHSYFIKIKYYDITNNTDDIIYGQKTGYFNPNPYNLFNKGDQIHQSVGFIHLKESNEYLGIGHVHLDLYKRTGQDQYGMHFGNHYTHFFYTIIDKPPFYINRISPLFCFGSPYNDTNHDCDITQFVCGLIEDTINNIDYFFISFGINDCSAAIVVIQKSFVTNLLSLISNHSAID
eukprot:83157_1